MTIIERTCSLPIDAIWTHRFDFDVQIFDTDCFGVMWHGAYLKWMELGRCKLLNMMGVTIDSPGQPDGFIYPVAEQNLQFKNKAPYAEPLRLTTVLRVRGFKMEFEQIFRSRHPDRVDQVTLQSKTTVLVLNSDWKIQRHLPTFLLEVLYANSDKPAADPEMIG
jgi:acyl-CoA thioester hydrolase